MKPFFLLRSRVFLRVWLMWSCNVMWWAYGSNTSVIGANSAFFSAAQSFICYCNLISICQTCFVSIYDLTWVLGRKKTYSMSVRCQRMFGWSISLRLRSFFSLWMCSSSSPRTITRVKDNIYYERRKNTAEWFFPPHLHGPLCARGIFFPTSSSSSTRFLSPWCGY